MLIYAVADIHAKQERLDNIRRVVETRKPDILVAAGDLGRWGRPREMVDFLAGLPIPVFAVRGNTDPPRMETMMHQVSGLDTLHLNRLEIGDIALAGIGGAVPIPFHTRAGFWEKRNLTALEPMVDQGTVLVTHTPPRRALDVAFGRFSVGSRALRGFIENRNPRLVICGHVHEQAGSAAIGRSLVINCTMGGGGNGALIKFTSAQIDSLELI